MSDLEKSKLWKQSVELMKLVDQIGQTIPGYEFYTISDPMHRTAITLSADIAMMVGRDSLKDSEYDLRSSRGRLISIKGFLLIAQELGYIQNIDSALVHVETLRRLIDEELTELKHLKEEEESK